MEVLSYQCPNCGAPLEFNSETQHWDCKFCLSSFGEEQLEEYNRQHSQEEEQTQEDSGEKKCYFCPNCGAELVTDDVTVATFCTFCGNPSVLPKKMEGEFHPKALIPFKLDKEQAKQALYDLCKKKPLLPKDFTSHSHIEKVTGIYVPFWLHDSYVNAQMKAIGKRIHVWRTKDVEYTKTDVYDIVREAAMTYRNIPTDASKQMNDDMMDALEPFSYDFSRDAIIRVDTEGRTSGTYCGVQFGWTPTALIPDNTAYLYDVIAMRSPAQLDGISDDQMELAKDCVYSTDSTAQVRFTFSCLSANEVAGCDLLVPGDAPTIIKEGMLNDLYACWIETYDIDRNADITHHFLLLYDADKLCVVFLGGVWDVTEKIAEHMTIVQTGIPTPEASQNFTYVGVFG